MVDDSLLRRVVDDLQRTVKRIDLMSYLHWNELRAEGQNVQLGVDALILF